MKARKRWNKWVCEVYLGRDKDGKIIKRQVSDPDKKRCEAKATLLAAEYKGTERGTSLGGALEQYVTTQAHVLSPATIRAYRSIVRVLRADHAWILRIACADITPANLQRLVSELTCSPKTMKNYIALIGAAMGSQGIDMPKVNLPRIRKEEPYIPSTEDVQKLLKASEGKKLHVPIMLAALGLRRSEICALRYPDDFRGNEVHISRALVQGDRGTWHEKGTKTAASDRWLQLPEKLMEEIQAQGYVCAYDPGELSVAFTRLVKRCGLPGFSLHKMRHYSASVMLGMGVPISIVEQRGGWSHGSPALNLVYTHVLSEQERKETDKINAFFEAQF